MRATSSSGYSRGEQRMTGLLSSLKATRGDTKDDPIAGLKRAQADYKAARTGFRNRQREVLEDVYRSVSDLLDDDEAVKNS